MGSSFSIAVLGRRNPPSRSPTSNQGAGEADGWGTSVVAGNVKKEEKNEVILNQPEEIIVHDICQEEPKDNISHHSYQSSIISHLLNRINHVIHVINNLLSLFQEQPEEPGTEISQGNASEEEEILEEQEEEENNSDDMLISSGEEESSSDDLFPSLEKQPEEIIAHDNCQENPETNIGHFQEQPEEPGTEISQGNASEEEHNLQEQEEEEINSDDMVIYSGEEESSSDNLFPSLEV
ncbi:protein ENDO16-like [Xenopus laevis]|uniref:Protein ENDO16-like n=1 Tax=Xenopus laevis TaxID=8355 RepID=A0A8J1KWB1_XENLA|nr:protein ENDO16-like [Xenopus laevis]